MAWADDWEPGRWWRVTYMVDGERKLWCETSDEDEARQHLTRVPFGTTEPLLERLWRREEHEWRVGVTEENNQQ